jgi:hypothetical protein
MSSSASYEQIRNLANRYFDAAWRQDVDAYVETFAEDGEIVFFGMPVPAGAATLASDPSNTPSTGSVLTFKGTSAIREMVKMALPAANPLPFGHNHVIELMSSTQASGTIMVALYSGNDHTLNTIAYYRDEYVKQADAWKIRRREAHNMPPGVHPTTR